MADNEDPPAAPAQPPKAPARRAPRKAAAAKGTAATSGTAKPATGRTRKTAGEANEAPKPPKPRAPAKPRAAGRAKPPAKRSPRGKAKEQAPPGQGGRNWTKAVLVGGLATVGAAATAALLSLRGSAAKKDVPLLPEPDANTTADQDTGSAHQPDGTDSTKSFQAGIADENTIPE